MRLRPLWQGLAGLLLAGMLRLLRWSWRLRVEGRPRPGGLHVFWHGDQLALAAGLAGVGATVLVSRSRDGELAARAARRLGFATARGSSHRGAVAATRALLRELRAGRTVGLAVDGPRGPRRRCGDSASRLARLGRSELVTVAAASRSGLTLPSWDRLRVPAPFTRVQIVFGGPHQGERVQLALERASEEAERLARSRAPGGGALRLLMLLVLLAWPGPGGCRPGTEQARRALASPEPAVRAEAIRQLGRSGDPAVGELVQEHLADSSPRVRRSAVGAIGALGLGSSSRALLLERLRDSDLEVRLGAVRVLGDSRDRRLQAPLLGALDDESPIVRRAAALALRALGLDPPEQARRRAALELDVELRRLGHPDEQHAVTAARLLGLSGRAAAVAPLLQRLAAADSAPLLQQELIVALGRLRDPRAAPELRRRTASGPPLLRAAAVAALRGWPGEQPRILALTRDASPEVRAVALRALEGAALSDAGRDAVCARLLDADEAVAGQAARLARLAALTCHEAGQVLHGPAPRWRVLGELPGDAPSAALVELARRRAAAYVEETARWIPAGRWVEVGDGADPGPEPAASPRRAPDPAKRAALARLLSRFPEPVEDGEEDPLLPPHTDRSELLALVEALAGRPAADELLLGLAAAPAPTPLRAAALRALLGSSADPAPARQPRDAARLRPIVEAGLASTDATLRRAAASGCALLGADAAAAAAEGLLGSSSFELRAAGTTCLIRAQGKRALPRLLQLLDEEPHLALIDALGRLGGGRAVDPLLRLLQVAEGGPAAGRIPLIDALGGLADSRAAPALEQELGDSDGAVRLAAAEALGSAGHAGSREALAACGEDFLAAVRTACREAGRRLAGAARGSTR